MIPSWICSISSVFSKLVLSLIKTCTSIVANLFSKNRHNETLNTKKENRNRMRKLIREKLFPNDDIDCETHKIKTKDGYILTIHHLIRTTKSPTKGVIFLQHGLLESSAVWLLRGYKSIGYNLLNQGYDVWLGNNRGNEFTYPSKEFLDVPYDKLAECKCLNDIIDVLEETESSYASSLYLCCLPLCCFCRIPSHPSVHNWSFNEMAFCDLSEMLTYVVRKTKVEKLSYVGFSQGTAHFFILMSQQPEYQKLIEKAVLLSPVAVLKSTFRIKILTKLVNIAPCFVMNLSIFIQYILPPFMIGPLIENVSRGLQFIKRKIDFEDSKLFFKYIPSGSTSQGNFRHWFQILWDDKYLNTRTLGNMDESDKKTSTIIDQNKNKSNNVPLRIPPENSAKVDETLGIDDCIYELEKINIPLHMILGKDDCLVNVKKFLRLSHRFPNLQSISLIPNASHADLSWNADTTCMRILLEILNQ